MESNTTSTSKFSILQGICGGLILIAYFLPWVQISYMGFGTSLSFFEGINQISKLTSSVSDISMYMGYNSIQNYAYILFLIPLLSFVNALIQWTGKYPRVAFYINIIPLAIIIPLIVMATKNGVNFANVAGIGIYITLLAAIVSAIDSWTTIGNHYYSKYKSYVIVLSIIVLASLPLSILTAILGVWGFIFVMFSAILSIIALIHFPFIIYCWIVILMTRDTQKRDLANQVHNPSVQSQEPTKTANNSGIQCPQCHKEVAADWTVCPYCGYNIQKAREEEEARIERAREEEKLRMEEKARAEAELKYTPGNTGQPTEEATPVTAPTAPTSPAAPSIQKTETPAPANPPASATVVPPAPRKSSAGLIAGIIIAILLVGGICSYIFWYRPYAKDRDALRTYVYATNLFLRSSKLAGVEYNIITKIPYGSELITYQKDSEWADIKFNGMKGYVASPFVLEKSDFDLLNNVWGNTDARECIISTKCRNAILDFLKRNQLQSGSHGWQIFTKGKDEKPNSVYYPRLYNKNSKYTDFAFLIRDNISGGRKLVIYSFGDESELPILRASITGIPAEGYLEYMGTNRYGKIIVNFSGGQNFVLNK